MLLGMQKINFIIHFFIKILQRNSKLVILGNLGMHGHTLNMIISIWHLSASQKSTSSLTFSSANFQIFQLFTIMSKIRQKLMSHPDKNAELIDGETTVIL